MNADAFRHLYNYHFTVNRKIWDAYIVPLSMAQFTQKTDYSVGSVRNQLVHLMSVDERWFSGLRRVELPDFANPVHYGTKVKLRSEWDTVETDMRSYFDSLEDEMLLKPAFPGDDEGKEFQLWQVLIHVANHGTDHRAQILALLNSLGVKTDAQDYFFFIKGNL